MNRIIGHLAPAATIALAVSGLTAVHANDDNFNRQRNAYVVTKLVSDLKNVAKVQDPVLQNAWGVAFSPAGSPFWVADNATGCSTLYAGDGTKVARQVSIPLPGNNVPSTSCQTVDPKNPPTNAAPTGIIWNPSSAFVVPGTELQAAFIFDTEDGTLSAWALGLTPNPNNAIIAVDNSPNGAVYKGLAFGVNVHGAFLFATNFNAGTIDVFGPNGPGGLFAPATTDGGFTDPKIPAGYAPFGIENIDGDLFVTYAQQNAEKHDDVKGPGHGFVDVFDTEDGTLSAWAGGFTPNPNNAVIAVDNSANGAVYKGLAFGVNVHGAFLFATNFNAGTIDVFGPNGPDGLFTPATTDGGFTDPKIPTGFAPFGIENINGDLFVTYAKQNAEKHDDVAGPGNGFVDVFDTNGHFLRRFASRGSLNSPWGVARASFAFGRFSGDILVGNFGNGKINVFDSRGRFIDELDRPNGKPVIIDGLWKLTSGGGRTSSSDTLYFTAGPNDEKDGLFGTITPVSGKGDDD